MSIFPKTLLRSLEVKEIQVKFKFTMEDLIIFDGGSTFYMDVGEYDTEEFESTMSMKYNYEKEEKGSASSIS